MWQSCADRVRCTRVQHDTKSTKPFNLPLIDQPFARVVIDLVSPLTITKAGQIFILAMVNYATWFPEAKPLKLTDIETIAKVFMIIFCHVRVTKQFLSDCGASLTGAEMQELYCQLGTCSVPNF